MRKLLHPSLLMEFVCATIRRLVGLVSPDRRRRPFRTLFPFFISIPKGSGQRLSEPNLMHFSSKSSNLL